MENEEKRNTELIVTLIPYKVFPAKTGGQKGIAYFTEYLAKETAITGVTVRSNDPLGANGYLLYNILSDKAFRYINPLYFFTLRKIIRKHKATHLLLEHPYYGWLGILLKWFCGVKLIVHSHNIESERWKSLGKWWWRILFFYEKWVHRNTDYNLFISDEDRLYALKQFHLSPDKCMTATFGTDLVQPPLKEDIHQAAAELRKLHSIQPDEHIFLFNGIFSYAPNADALRLLMQSIYPALLQAGLQFKIIICGRDIPSELAALCPPEIIMAGFVDDLALYLKGADLFLNPITDGGGIKTKLVEALAFDLSSVSFESGALGVPVNITGGKLHTVKDLDVTAFCEQVFSVLQTKDQTIPDTFFAHFSWVHIARKVNQFIKA